MLNHPLKILFIASEAAPFVKVGGLGEVMYSLPRALNHLGHDARVMIPRYASIDPTRFPLDMLVEGLKVPSGMESPVICNVKVAHRNADNPESPTDVFFLENQEYYEKRANVYGYDDDAARWALLSRGALEFIRSYAPWQPDIIVGCDWQSGLIADMMHRDYQHDPVLSKISVVFSIHNLHYQGMFDHHFVTEMDYDDGQSEIPPLNNPRLLKLNFMRRGIMHADVINTVSPTYAKEITTPEYGELLDTLLQERRSRLYGILNGIDYESSNPENDTRIEKTFNARHLKERAINKISLRQKFNLPDPINGQDAPIIGIVSRLSEQKGFDLLMEIAEPLLANTNVQLVILGTGDPKYISYFQELDKKHARVAAHLSYDDILPHVIYAGADAVLIPSRYEPCGLTQMEAMRYGAVPIVRKTGGLADSVVDFDPREESGNGFVFEHYDAFALYGCIIRTIEAYHRPKSWIEIQKRAMNSDFSWGSSAKEYVKLFEKALNAHKQSDALG